MSNVAGVVILYFPDVDQVLKNISTYINDVSELLIINNTPGNDTDLRDKLAGLKNNDLYWKNAENEGIAKPLNAAATWALERGYQWLLTMDQDSCFKPDEIRRYMEWVRHGVPGDIAIAGPSYEAITETGEAGTVRISSVNKVITSGSIINLQIWEKLKGFDERFFIDEVDHEYCYHAIQERFKVVCLQNIHLTHKMGNLVTRGYFGKFAKRPRMVHSPLRIYYMVRNYLLVRKKYRQLMPGEIHARNKEIKVILKNNLLFSGQFVQTLKMAVKGYLDYRKGVFGKYS
ncbi:glycosyltransferase [Flavihumibacter fluvii]|uniref:glycosyltransferase n=1 Tax=Flavihumibacter fluvii TaxID=2838157 RepID=UPI001BDE1596|nr:glycosyltransferase [Flavihumibacter fluvii]ULQ53783.1 glycosyltransferase [Flavihumibacter fluvii]